jgi:hypothetical protein
MRGRGMYSYTSKSRVAGRFLASPVVSLRSASFHSLCSARVLASVESNGMEWNGMKRERLRTGSAGGMKWNGMK